MNDANKTVTVVICVYNRQGFIKRCLESVLAQTYQNTSVIVIDDGSSDKTTAVLEDFSENKKISIYHNSQNLGLMVSRNRGASMTDSEIIAYLDSDCVAEPDWLEELIKPFSISADIVITGGRIEDPLPAGYWQAVMAGTNFIRHKSGYTHKIMGGNMAFRKDFLINNKFDETLKYGGDETDLCLRTLKLNLKIYYQDSARVTHYHRKNFIPLVKQRFFTGVGNYYIRLKNRAFPFISVKSLVLLMGALSLALSIFIPPMLYLSIVSFILYAGRVLYENYRPRRKNLAEVIFSFPGKLILAIIEDAGYIYGIGHIARLK